MNTKEIIEIINALTPLGESFKWIFLTWLIVREILSPAITWLGIGWVIWITRKAWVAVMKAILEE